MFFGEFHQNFPVYGDVLFVERADKLAVADALLAEGGVEVHQPQAAHHPLFGFAVAVSVTAGFQNRHLSELDFAFSSPHVTLGFAENIFTMFEMRFSSFYSGHDFASNPCYLFPLMFGNWKLEIGNLFNRFFNRAMIRLRHGNQFAFGAGDIAGFAGVKMAASALAFQNLSGSGDAESF